MAVGAVWLKKDKTGESPSIEPGSFPMNSGYKIGNGGRVETHFSLIRSGLLTILPSPVIDQPKTFNEDATEISPAVHSFLGDMIVNGIYHCNPTYNSCLTKR